MKDATAAWRADGLLAAAPVLDRRRMLALALLAPAAAAGLTACGPAAIRKHTTPDPLIALADAARADAALAAAAITANPDLTARVDPLRAARTEHAAALDAEVVRAGGTPHPATPAAGATPAVTAAPGVTAVPSAVPSAGVRSSAGASAGASTAAPAASASGAPGSAPPSAAASGLAAVPTGVTQTVTLAKVREAVAASQRAAADVVPGLPADRVGLVASVAACCGAYAAVLG